MTEVVYVGGEKDYRAHALALKAADIDHEISVRSGQFTLAVTSADAARVHSEIEAYVRDNHD